MRNSTGSPLFSDFKSDLSRVVRSRPLVKGNEDAGYEGGDYSSRVWVLTKARGLDQVSVVDDAKRRRRQQKTRDKEDLAGQAFWDLFPQCLASIQDACTRCFLRGTEKVDFGE